MVYEIIKIKKNIQEIQNQRNKNKEKRNENVLRISIKKIIEEVIWIYAKN